jgi:hypothetical protein
MAQGGKDGLDWTASYFYFPGTEQLSEVSGVKGIFRASTCFFEFNRRIVLEGRHSCTYR